MKRTTESQVKIVKRELKAGKKLTPLQMLNEYGIFRLAARIETIKNVDGWPIKSKMIYLHPIKYAQYSLIKTKQK